MESMKIQDDIMELNSIIPHFLNLSKQKVWFDYDREADVLYINYRKPQRADDSEMLDRRILIVK